MKRIAPGFLHVGADALDGLLAVGPACCCGNQPSASFAMRRIAASALPPIQMGMGRCTGIGARPDWWMVRILAVEVDEPLGPEPAEERDLLFGATAAVVEVLAQRFVLERVPADADTETQAATREDVHLGCLLATSAVWRCGRMMMLVTNSMRRVRPAR